MDHDSRPPSIAIAPVWSHMVRRTPLTAAQVGPYVDWLAARYNDRPNVVWLNGGSAQSNGDWTPRTTSNRGNGAVRDPGRFHEGQC
jgi:hypothetical protein